MAFDPVPHPKGAARRIETTVRALAAAGSQVTLLTPGPGRLEGVDHQTVDLPQRNFLDRVLAFRAAAEAACRRPGWDLLWFRSIWEGLPAVREAGRRGLRVVYEAHGFPSVELPSHYPRVLEHEDLLDQVLVEEQAVLRGADLVVTPSRTGRHYLLGRGVPPGRVRVVPNAVDCQRFPWPPPPLPPAPPYRLAYLGTLAPWQGLGLALEALALLKNRLEVRLVVAGPHKGPWERELRQMARALGVRSTLEMVGPVVPEEFLPTAHFCLAPLPEDPRNGLQGCCPIKVLEYMACGRPILATDIRPLREVLRHGITAWLARPGSPWSLARGLGWLVEHPGEAAALAARAREEARERWSPQVFLGHLGTVLEDLGRVPPVCRLPPAPGGPLSGSPARALLRVPSEGPPAGPSCAGASPLGAGDLAP